MVLFVKQNDGAFAPPISVRSDFVVNFHACLDSDNTIYIFDKGIRTYRRTASDDWAADTITDDSTFKATPIGDANLARYFTESQVVLGTSNDEDHPVLIPKYIKDGVVRLLPPLIPGQSCTPVAYRTDGTILGFTHDAAGKPHGVLWVQDKVSDLGTGFIPQYFGPNGSIVVSRTDHETWLGSWASDKIEILKDGQFTPTKRIIDEPITAFTDGRFISKSSLDNTITEYTPAF